MTLYDFRLKCKELWERFQSREVYTVILIVLVGFASFGLGRLSRLEQGRGPILITVPPASQTASALSPVKSQTPKVSSSSTVDTVVSPILPAGGQVVASKNGGKYHFPWCSGAQRISEANKVWFDSVEEARKAGYAPASNCKGLK